MNYRYNIAVLCHTTEEEQEQIIEALDIRIADCYNGNDRTEIYSEEEGEQTGMSDEEIAYAIWKIIKRYAGVEVTEYHTTEDSEFRAVYDDTYAEYLQTINPLAAAVENMKAYGK